MTRVTWLSVAVSAAILAGCPRVRQNGDKAAQGELPAGLRPSVTLRVVVVNEGAFAEAIDRLRGEWAEHSGGELKVAVEPWRQVKAWKETEADLLVFPSRYLGELCVHDRLRPVRSNVLESDDLQATDFFPLVRYDLIQWGGQTMALPLGVELVGRGAPLDRHSGLSLLAGAASAAISTDRLGALFDTQTMKPRIEEQPFVDALDRLAQASVTDERVPLGSEAVVPVFGYSDRLMGVTTSSRNAASAFKLLEWLAQPEISTQLAAMDRGTMPVRRSLLSSSAWYDPTLVVSERAERGAAIEAALSGRRFLLVPRIPGVDEYLATLDQAVKAAVLDGVSPKAALRKAAERWEQITDAHGREAQRQAYLKHLGIGEP